MLRATTVFTRGVTPTLSSSNRAPFWLGIARCPVRDWWRGLVIVLRLVGIVVVCRPSVDRVRGVIRFPLVGLSGLGPVKVIRESRFREPIVRVSRLNKRL